MTGKFIVEPDFFTEFDAFELINRFSGIKMTDEFQKSLYLTQLLGNVIFGDFLLDFPLENGYISVAPQYVEWYAPCSIR